MTILKRKSWEKFSGIHDASHLLSVYGHGLDSKYSRAVVLWPSQDQGKNRPVVSMGRHNMWGEDWGGGQKNTSSAFFVQHSVVQVSLMTPTVPSWQMIGTAFKTRGKIALYLPPEGPECKCDAPAREAATLILAEQTICKEATIAYYRTGVVVLCRKRVEESEIRTKAETRPD